MEGAGNREEQEDGFPVTSKTILSRSKKHWEILQVILCIEMTTERSVGYENVGPKWEEMEREKEGSENMGLKTKKIWAVASLKIWINSICWQQLGPLNSEMKMEKHSRNMNLKIGLWRLKLMTFMWGLEILQIFEKNSSFNFPVIFHILHSKLWNSKLPVHPGSNFLLICQGFISFFSLIPFLFSKFLVLFGTGKSNISISS